MNTNSVNAITPDRRSAHHAPPTTNPTKPAADPTTETTDTPGDAQVPQPRTESAGPPEVVHDTTNQEAVFSRGRLRAYRDLAKLTRDQLAAITSLPVTAIIDYETGTAAPTMTDLTTLAHALNVTLDQFTGPPDAEESWEYWDLICAALPPLTGEQIATIGAILRRIDDQHQPTGPPGTSRRG